MKQEFLATAVNGKPELDSTGELYAFLKKIPNHSRIKITVEQYVGHLSHSQRKYYHGVVVRIPAEHLGWEKQDMHNWFKENILAPDFNVSSTSELTPKQAEEYFEHIRRWAMQNHGCYIPMPHEVLP